MDIKPLKTTKSNNNRNNNKSNSNNNNNNNNTNNRNKKAKRLPWNTEVLSDRITPQPYQVQLIDECIKTKIQKTVIFTKTDEWKNYFKIMTIKQYALINNSKLILIVTNLTSDVNKQVEIISRHTTFRIAGIDFNTKFDLKLKQEAHLLIMSVNTLLDWFSHSHLSLNELKLIIFDDVNGAFHNDAYKTIMDNYLSSSSTSEINMISYGILNIELNTTHSHLCQQIEYLKSIFKFDYIETGTDLIGTFNLFNGIEPTEHIHICNTTTSSSSSDQFETLIIKIVKETYQLLEDLNESSSLNYISQLCYRVLDECIYLLNEVGLWCFAKSLLPFICQLDKLSTFIESNQQQHKLCINKDFDFLNNDLQFKQKLILQYTSTSLRRIRELCIKQFLATKTNNHLIKLKSSAATTNTSSELFMQQFTTSKVQALIQLLKEKRHDDFCCLVFVQNKQVATSLSLLLKKLAKEDQSLNYLYPNYVIGTTPPSSNEQTNSSPSNSLNSKLSLLTSINNSNETPINSDCLKQEEILRRFYSGDINLLICTYEMEEHISVPACVNLLIRFNCHTQSGSTDDSFNYFSYINTKSRAQLRHAECYFFIEKSNFDSFFLQFVRFKQIEHTLLSKYSQLVNKNKPNSVTISSNHNKTSLNLNNSIQIINKYCIRLPSDALTQLTAKCLFQTKNNLVKCVLYLPINSGYRDPIESDWHSTSELAQANAAYNACLILYDKNELNEYLEPITKELFYKLNTKMDSDDEREWSQFSSYFHNNSSSLSTCLTQQQISNYMSHRPGGNKRKQTYAKKQSSYLKLNQIITTQHQCYLYLFKTSVITPLTGNTTSEKQQHHFGLLTSKLLLEIVDFPIFTQNGEETVSVHLIKSSLFLTPNQLKLIKQFHKFIFSNVLRMDGCGSLPMPYLFDSISSSNSSSKKILQQGCYICILNLNSQDIDWNLMKSIESISDRQFLKVPNHAKRIDDNVDEKIIATNNENEFKFNEKYYIDSVVIPFYRANDIQPQFYCVSSIDYTTNPLSPFPISSSSSTAQNTNSSSQYETFYQYFALKYNYLITNIQQPMLIVSHPSTRLNLLTPRYMNMKTNVIQKSYHFSSISSTSTTTTTKITKKSSNSSKIFLVPELVNIHPLSASVWRRSLCLPSILYRLNSLLLAEELRREIAQSTGIGEPWYSIDHSFTRLSFDWDRNKEIEICDMPDLEVDVATIKQRNNDQADHKHKQQQQQQQEDSTNNDSKWNFEISEWDSSLITKSKSNNGSNSNNKGGWSDMFINEAEPKTLFIDPCEMELIAEDEYYSDSDDVKFMNTNNKEEEEEEEDYEDEEDDEDEEEDLKSQFTIDIDKLKADLKKKSAKLLSKLSVQSNNFKLVKNLTEFDLEADYEDFKINLNEISRKNSKQLVSGVSIANEQILIDTTDLNMFDWFNKIKYNDSTLINEIKNKYFNSLTTPPSTHNSLTFNNNDNKEINLPFNKQEIKQLIKYSSYQQIPAQDLKWTGTTTTSFRNTDWQFDFSLDDSNKLNNGPGPGPDLLLQALTLSNAADGFDLERLETVGDSFLKQAITVYLYLTYPNIHEGKLSYLRSKQVSNYNLYKLGKRKGLQELIISNKFEPLESWLPPHYDSAISLNMNSNVSQVLSTLLSSKTTKNIESQQQQQQFDKYKDHIISDKSIADCVEAIIGAYLITSGPQAALRIMTWFDLKVLPRAKCEDGSEVFVDMPDLPEPKVNDPSLLHSLLDGYASFEACIGYKFKQPVYLLQAFTHASYTYNTITDCYQRLEFLGDAILDYVITRHLYEDKKRHSPGELTDLRSSLVNNNIFAHLAVKYEFYKYFKYLSPSLFTIIDNFVQNQKNRNDEFDLDEDFFDYQIDDDEYDDEDDIEDEEFILSDQTVATAVTAGTGGGGAAAGAATLPNELEEMEVPKCLGDIFESVAGAIFLDSGKSFDTVWRVYYGLMKPHIDKFTNQVPKSPIRELFELEPEAAKFEKPERTIDGKIRVTVSVFGRGKFKGVGRNYRIAKNAAAKLALKFLKNHKN